MASGAASLKAPAWYRDANGPQGLRPLPPTAIVTGALPVSSSLPPHRSGVPLPSVPPVPSNTAQRPTGLPPPLPALAIMPPPPPAQAKKGVAALMPALPAPPGAALALIGGKSHVGRPPDRPAVINAAPKSSDEKVFLIPGLQNQPFTEEELQLAFDAMDLDNHGYIGQTDIRRILSLCGETEPSEIEVNEMIRVIDPDGSGTVEYHEFRKHFMEPPPIFRNFDLHIRGSADDSESDGEAPKVQVPMAILNRRDSNEGSVASSRHSSGARGNAHKDHRFEAVAIITGGRAGTALKPEFIKYVYQRFIELDTQDAGFITFKAFCEVLQKVPDEQLRRAFNAFDVDHMGELDLRQFVVSLSMFTSSTKEEKLRFAFMMYDEDQTGSLTRQELEELMKAMAPHMRGYRREAHAGRVFSEHNIRPNGRIQLVDFLDYIDEHAEEFIPGASPKVGKEPQRRQFQLEAPSEEDDDDHDDFGS